jgi:sugar phosphate isomerase/epimerase
VQVGSMNSPFRPLPDEIRRIANGGFDFVDLTLEPPGAWPIDADEVQRVVAASGLDVVGHTAYYLPIASPFRALRAAARELLVQAFEVFAAVGASLVNLHPDPITRSYPRADAVSANAEAVRELTEAAKTRRLTLMVENLGPRFGTVELLTPVLEAHPETRFHLDVGHAHLGGKRVHELLAAFGGRLAHVHVSDNFGVDDLHLPLGAGAIDWPEVIAALKRVGYDGTVTLEVFSEERRHLETSHRLWREWWA